MTVEDYEMIIEEIEKYGYEGRKRDKEVTLYKDAINEKTDLRQETEKLKAYVNGDEERLQDILPKALAIISEAGRRFGLRPYPVQLIGAMALSDGNIAEMKTGEGKTLTAIVAGYLNALVGRGVHITTSNEYLAVESGFKNMGPILEEAGLTVGVITGTRNNQDKKSLEERRKAYRCDVTYASSDALAFDYLYDQIAKSEDEVVFRRGKPGFVIIDEADQVLVNNATTPFIIAGVNEDEELEKQKNYQLANDFVYQLFLDQEHCLGVNSQEQLYINLYGNKDASRFNQRFYSVIYSKSFGAELTELGQLTAFSYFCRDAIKKRINDPLSRDLILNSSDFKLGQDADYFIDDKGEINLTLRGIERATRLIPSIHELNELYHKKVQETGFNQYINNALKAYFAFTERKDYTLMEGTDLLGNKGKKLTLIIDGRAVEGRAYTNGLQQALELKERTLKPSENVLLTPDTKEIAKISPRSFFASYSKVGGMTGTSAENIFENIYGMPTIKIPKNSEHELSLEEQEALAKTRVNKPTIVFATEEEKINATINSIVESIAKGQPVLVGTYSDKESIMLARLLRAKGIECTTLNTSDAKREAEIVAQAGIKGAVTISTQMAGRGTDIKLGGDMDYITNLYLTEKANEMVDYKFKGVQLSSVQRERLLKSALKYVLEHKEEILTTKKEELKAFAQEKKDELMKVGGLKVIGFGHYETKRNDDQLRGRSARQNDPGVTEFYCSVKGDLEKKLKVPKEAIDELLMKGLKPGKPMTGDKVSKIVSDAQRVIEGEFESSLEANKKQDELFYTMRQELFAEREEVLYAEGKEIQKQMKKVVISSVKDIINDSIVSGGFDLEPKTKLSSVRLNEEELIYNMKKYFGVDLRERMETSSFATLGDIESAVTNAVLSKYRRIRDNNGDEKQDKIDKERMLGMIDASWGNFQDSLEDITAQRNLNSMANNSNFSEEREMRNSYIKAIKEAKLETLAKTFGRKQEKVSSEQKDIDDPEINNDYYVFDLKDTGKIRNLKVETRLAMFNLSVKFRLLKEQIGKKISEFTRNKNLFQITIKEEEKEKDNRGIKK